MMIKRLASLLVGGLALASCGLSRQAPPPSPVYPIPTEAQIAWQRLETYAFVHFGLNTFNDLEWGYGNTPGATFAPDTLDVEQWVRTFKQAGMRGVILTAKHHDGFCLWPTKTTEYSVKNSPWKEGKGDLVRELSDACRRYGLRFGLYLSPWDRHHAEYGRPEYQRTFHEQIRELAEGYGELFEYWFDGANGGTGWYGGADETRSINPKEYYLYEEAAKILRANNPNIMIFGGTVPTIRWIGNEQGWAGQTNYSAYSYEQEEHHKQAQWGMRDADQWLPGEVDVSIRPGWFYHQREDHQVRSVASLTNIYYQSVGRNANLLLNFPVALDGRIPKTDSLNAVHWHQHLQQSFAKDLLAQARIEARNTRQGETYAPKHLIDNSDDTYWATASGAEEAEVVFYFPHTRVNTIGLQEYIRFGQRVDAFELATRDASGAWLPIRTVDSLTTIGYKRLIRLEAVDTDAIRLRITKARGEVCLASVSAYLVPELVEPPMIHRTEDDKLVLTSTAYGNELRYRVADGPWQTYTQPVPLLGHHVEVEAQAVSRSDARISAQSSKMLGYSASIISTPEISPELRVRLLDGEGNVPLVLPKGVRELTLELDKPRPIARLEYIPDQRRDANGHIQDYELYIDDQLVAKGEFANIKNNPIPTDLILDQPIVGRRLRLVVVRTAGDTSHVSIGSLQIY